MAIKRLRFEKYDELDGYWIVTWLGQVFRSQSDPSNVSINVAVSKLKSFNGDKVDLESGIIDFSNTHIIECNIGMLPTLHVGSVLLNGEHTKVECKNRYSVDVDFGVNYEKEYFGASYEFDGRTHYYVPFKCYPLWASGDYSLITFKKAHYFVFSVTGTHSGKYKNILLPSTEITRYFYGFTAKITNMIFNGTFINDFNEIFDLDQCEIVGDTAKLVVRKTFDKDEIKFLAKLYFNDFASREIKNINTRVAIPKKYKKEVYFEVLKTFPPVLDHKKIRFIGKELDFKDSKNLLVCRILNCQMDIPFRNIEYKWDDESLNNRESDSKNQDGSYLKVNTRNHNEEVDAKWVSGKDPDIQKRNIHYYMDDEDQMADIGIKRIFNDSDTERPQRKIASADNKTVELSTNNPKYLKDGNSPNPLNIFQGPSHTEKKNEKELSTRESHSFESNFEYFSHVLDDLKGFSKELEIEKKTDELIWRRKYVLAVVIVQIKYGNRFMYLLELKNREKESFSTMIFRSYNYRYINVSDRLKIIKCIERNSKFRVEKFFKQYVFTYKKHTINLAQNIFEVIKEIL